MGKLLLAVSLVGLVGGRAHGDAAADVEKLVRVHVAASTGKQGPYVATLASPNWLVGADGSYVPLFAECEADQKADACENSMSVFGSGWWGTATYKNVKPVVRVDASGNAAAFYVTADATAKLDGASESESAAGKTKMRVAGIAKLDGKQWKVVGAKYSGTLSDKALFAYGMKPDARTLKPGTELQKQVASWFGHLAEHASASVLGANGTSPGEIATSRPAAIKLAKSWDKLDLQPRSFDGLEAGNFGFVTLDVALTTKKSKQPVLLSMGIVAIKEGETWKWVAIDFGSKLLTAELFR